MSVYICDALIITSRRNTNICAHIELDAVLLCVYLLKMGGRRYPSTSVLKLMKIYYQLSAMCKISGFTVTSGVCVRAYASAFVCVCVCVWLLLSSLQCFTRSSAPTAILRVWWASATAASNVIITSSVRTASGGGMPAVPIATSTKWRSIRHG